MSRQEATDHLSLILEAILENYGEYRDYNSTTTQSDRGDMLYTLLDFLRLRTEYDRICWHLKPVILAHEILVSRHQEKAARLWRRALTDRIGQEAEQYLTRLRALQKKYAIRMPTIADRIAERFVRPMAIDRMRALVRPAMDESRRPGPKPVFELLEHETQILAGESTGIGFDVPGLVAGAGRRSRSCARAHASTEFRTRNRRRGILRGVVPRRNSAPTGCLHRGLRRCKKNKSA